MNYVLRVSVSNNHYRLYFMTLEAAEYEAQIAQEYYESKGFVFDLDTVAHRVTGILQVDDEITVSVDIAVESMPKCVNSKNVPWRQKGVEK